MPPAITQNMPQKKILIVDDDPEVRFAMNIRLKANHYDVAFATDGLSGIAETRRQNPDLILLDLGLPSGDGYTVLEKLHADGSMSSIPVIVISSRDRTVNQDRSLRAGAQCFLQKPVKNIDLLATIERVLASCATSQQGMGRGRENKMPDRRMDS